MAAQKHRIVICADTSYSNVEITELAEAFSTVFEVHIGRYQRFGAVQYAPIIEIVFGSIAAGFFQAIGKALWEAIKKKLAATIAEKQQVSEVEFKYAYETKSVELRVSSADENVIATAFDQIQNTLEIVEKRQEEYVYLEFEPKTEKWVPIGNLGSRRVVFHFQGVIATTDPITVRGEPFQFSEEDLKEAAKRIPGLPINYEHSGPPLGRVETSWYENGKLMVKGVIFEPNNNREREILESIKLGNLKGLSLAFSHAIKRH